jgi:hypothetical protein
MTALRALERFARRTPPPIPEGEHCGLCAGAIEEPHRHFVELTQRRILCACRTCWLAGGMGDRLRPVPERVLRDPAFAIDERQWAALGVPVRLVFLFHNSTLGRWVAVFPGPAGATESELTPAPWLAEAPLPARLAPDVEALLIFGRLGRPFEALLVPIDLCYELVARVRLRWQGFHGGDEAWTEIEAFFDRLRARALPLAEVAG